MATDVPQRQLRNHTADLLRRVEAGERLRITVHGHPVAELVPVEGELPPRAFAPLESFFEEMADVLDPADRWAEEIRETRNADRLTLDPFEKPEKQHGEEGRHGPQGEG